jgi:NAD(P)-dependent dehydrogenase (short-subunit alcohol dehydrogenase family)
MELIVAGVLRHNEIRARPGQTLEELHIALSSSDPKDWNDTLSTNVTAVYYTIVAFMPLLGNAAKKGQGRGSVVITGSVGGLHWDKFVDTHDYGASKAYSSLTRC